MHEKSKGPSKIVEVNISLEELKLALKMTNNSAAGLDKIKFDLIRKLSIYAQLPLLSIVNDFLNSA